MAASQDILEQLSKDTKDRIASVKSKINRDYSQDIEVLEKSYDELTEVKQDDERKRRSKIVDADFEKLRVEVDQEAKDLAQAVYGLRAIFDSLGAEYDKLLKLSTDEQALIDKSNRDVAIAEANRQQIEAWKFGWFGLKSRSLVKGGNSIAEAKQGLTESQTEANRLARQRLLSADLEESMQNVLHQVEQTIEIAEARMEIIAQQLEKVSVRKLEAFRIKEKAARKREEFEQNQKAKEQELLKEEDRLSEVVSGTPEHSVQTQKISELRRQVEDLRGKANTALILYESKEKFATELELHERGQLALLHNQRMWVTSLRSDTEERIVTFKSRLEAMKAMSDQQVAKELDTLGAAVDQSNAEFMASVATASDKAILDKIEQHPIRMRKMISAVEARADAVQTARVREAKIIEDFKRQYGIDPMESSFLRGEDNKGAEAKPKASGGEYAILDS